MDRFLMLSRVSDTLQIPLTLDPSGTLTTTAKSAYTPVSGLSVPCSPIPIVAFCPDRGDTGGAVFRIMGNLCIMVGVNGKTNIVSLYLLNVPQGKDLEVGKNFDLSMAFKAIESLVVQSYLWKDSKWVPFKYIPK